ncbi:MAG: alanine--tRNA ligase [Mycoplasma sp.]
MKKMTANEIRRTWLDFFMSKDHLEVQSASLIPVNDNSLLWINSGVATLKDFFSGKKNPPHANLTNSQKCIRTNDIENVGMTSRHHTFFEMLGNFSIGGYFKEEAIEFGFELLTKKFEIEIEKLYITVFEDDQITFDKWISLGIDKAHIIKCGRDRNFWDVGSGPCGPCTEIFYDRGTKYDPNNIGEKLFFEDIENDRYIEIWNIVFSEFNNDGNNNYTQLMRKNIDTGAGLERIACISQSVPTNFDTDLFLPIIKEVEKHSSLKYDMDAYFSEDSSKKEINKSFKMIADHARASVFAIADGAMPSNKERGYILRRLIRSMIVALIYKLKIEDNVLTDIAIATINNMCEYYPYLKDNSEKICGILNKEYEIFSKTLKQGFKLFEEAVSDKKLDGNSIFKLVETYGFPIEIIQMLGEEKNIQLDIRKFEELFKEHQAISNARKNEIAMNAQNGELLNLDTPFKFLYDVNNIKAKIVKLYDETFTPVEKLDGSGYVVFDETCFYATSGGQLNDIGFIDGTILVDDVIKGPNLQHIHHVENAVDLKLNSEHILTHDELRRSLLSKNHSVEHLIHSALRVVVDKNIKQEGAFKSPEKVTFDFQYHQKLSDKQIEEIENWINSIIAQSIPTEFLELTLEEAQEIGAAAYFADVYKKIKGKLRVIKMGEVSCELCGGTHVHNSKDIEQVKIVSVFSRAAGSWRIEAITSHNTIANFKNDRLKLIQEEIERINSLGINNDELTNSIQAIDFNSSFESINENFDKMCEVFKVAKMNADKEKHKAETNLVKETMLTNEENVVVANFENLENRNMFNALTELINEHQDKIFVAFNMCENKIQYMLATNEKNKSTNLNVAIKLLNQETGGKGGGKPNFVQGGCSDYLDISKLKDIIRSELTNA